MEPSLALPIPPDLALVAEPIPEDLLERWTNYVIETAADAGVDPESLADTLRHDEVYVPEAITRFAVDDDGKAEWAMRHVARIVEERAGLAAQAEEWIDRITGWFEQRSKPLATREAFFRAHLERYALAVREASGGKTKSVTLPSGRIQTTSTKPKIVVEDETELLAWVRDNLEPDQVSVVIKTTEKVLVSELRDAVVLVELPSRVVCSPCGCVDAPKVRGVYVNFDTVADVAAWTAGSAVECPSCGNEALVGQWVETYLAVRDEAGRPVPGADVAAGSISANVKASS